ncbi:hypothetical protein NEIMUCOT_04321 [Neisseria mucosa ATCC 25996]|uniref:Uncharacterized protein n=1 Tax=Neisseria mucosa (strain ATCC 25996 / DSM 4631 / NCTC 10774 / M26) TaxID=546266 RepID=D2ZUN0_NEIM2|nr:hypothetical protein NEIMUCOT_04321 [Neisseria mucosa ATCC 25996]
MVTVGLVLGRVLLGESLPLLQAAKLRAIIVAALTFFKDIDASFAMSRLIIEMQVYYQPVI